MSYVLHLGDCLDPVSGLVTLADRSVDICLTDPPFSERVHARLGKEDRSDGTAPRDALTFEHITEAQAYAMAAQLCRVVREWIIVFCDEVSLVLWKDAIEAAGGEYVRKGTWLKVSPMPQMSGDRPSVGTEEIVIAHAPRTSGRMQWNGGGKTAVYRASPHEPGVPRIHPNQKPQRLLRGILIDFADPGDLILDPYAGSASTGVAALSMGLRFAGWERSPATWEDASARLSGNEVRPHPDQLTMFSAHRLTEEA